MEQQWKNQHARRSSRAKRRSRWSSPPQGAGPSISWGALALLGLFLAIVITLAVRTWIFVQPETDAAVAAMTVSYKCPKCGHAFSLPVAEAGEMRRSRGDIVCPRCSHVGAQKQDVSVVVSGDEAPTAEPPEEGEARAAKPSAPAATRTRDPP